MPKVNWTPNEFMILTANSIYQIIQLSAISNERRRLWYYCCTL